jgi:hypothetical protein
MSLLDELAPGQTIKSITIRQPWATIIAAGHKTLETRGWRTDYKGPIAIHAAKTYDDEDRWLVRRYPFQEALIDAQDRGLFEGPELPLSAVVAVARLVGCFSTPPDGRGRYDMPLSDSRGGHMKLPPDQPERDLGHFGAGRYAWRLVEVTPIVPIPQRGYRQVWDWTIPQEWSSSYGSYGRGAMVGLAPIPPVTELPDPASPRHTHCLCGSEASGHCDICGRGWCEPHAKHIEAGVICYACHARGRLRRRPCAMCGCQSRLAEPRNREPFTPCPMPDPCSCHALEHVTEYSTTGRRCAFCAGTGTSRGGVACMYCGGTGRHVEPITAS